jgi:hypothetical protein
MKRCQALPDDAAIKIHPAIPVSLFNRMEDRIAQRGITRSAFVIDAIRRVLNEPVKAETEQA